MRLSINCSTIIHLPTLNYAILREATSETYGPRVYSHHINLHYFILLVLLLLFTLHLYTKNTKNIISIRSHSRSDREGIDNP